MVTRKSATNWAHRPGRSAESPAPPRPRRTTETRPVNHSGCGSAPCWCVRGAPVAEFGRADLNPQGLLRDSQGVNQAAVDAMRDRPGRHVIHRRQVNPPPEAGWPEDERRPQGFESRPASGIPRGPAVGPRQLTGRLRASLTCSRARACFLRKASAWTKAIWFCACSFSLSDGKQLFSCRSHSCCSMPHEHR